MKEILKQLKHNLDFSENKYTGNQVERALESVSGGEMHTKLGHPKKKKY